MSANDNPPAATTADYDHSGEFQSMGLLLAVVFSGLLALALLLAFLNAERRGRELAARLARLEAAR